MLNHGLYINIIKGDGMKKSTQLIITKLKGKYKLFEKLQLEESLKTLIECYVNGNKLLVCGNGGSASDSLHIVGELMKGFLLPRKLSENKQKSIRDVCPECSEYLIDNLQSTLPAISLVSEISLLTAYNNDKSSNLVFAQQVLGYGNKGDVLLAISTSGNSKNVVYAAKLAKVQGMKVISLTGNNGGLLRELSDVLINVPFSDTFIIQEFHIIIYHAICAAVENEFFSEGKY